MFWICERCGTENEYKDADSAIPCICCGKRPGVTEFTAAEKAYRAKEEEESKAKHEEQKAREDAERRVQAEAVRRAREEAERRTREEIARKEAERRTREEIARKEAERRTREEIARKEAERKAKEKKMKRYWMIQGVCATLAWVGAILLTLILMTFLQEWIISLEVLSNVSEKTIVLVSYVVTVVAWWLMIHFIEECIDIWPLIIPAIVGCIMIYGIVVNGFAWLKEDPRWVFTHLWEIMGLL